jgi:TolB protein
MMPTSLSFSTRAWLAGGTLLAALLLLDAGERPLSAQQPPPPQQPSEITATITSDQAGTPPRLAIPDFVALSNDAETQDAAATIARVLADDITFEHEFLLMPLDIIRTIPPITSLRSVSLDRWREVNADGVVLGTVQKNGNGVRVEVKLFNIRSGAAVFTREYSGGVANKRLFAHSIADDIHKEQRSLRGVARTKLTFSSDRDGERMTNTVEARGVREIYIADYDGENQRRLTVQKSLNINSTWSPDGRSIAYTSYRRGPPHIFISNIYQGTLEELTKGNAQDVTPVWAPDGSRVAFASTRDGNFEIYVADRNGSNVRRLTNHPAADITPTWSPSGTQIAFTSDRTGTPQIYIVGSDGLGLRQLTRESYADRATWSPAPYNEVAYTARTGPGNDLKIMELATGVVRQLTFGEGTNESPSFSANGRHLAFMSTRSGKNQIFTMARDGKDIRQITRVGDNRQPDWSK